MVLFFFCYYFTFRSWQFPNANISRKQNPGAVISNGAGVGCWTMIQKTSANRIASHI